MYGDTSRGKKRTIIEIHRNKEPSLEGNAFTPTLLAKSIPKSRIYRVTFFHGNVPECVQVLKKLRGVEKLLPFYLHPESRNLGNSHNTEPVTLQVEGKAIPNLEEVQSIIDFDGDMKFIRQSKAQTHNLQGLMESLESNPECMRLPIIIDWTSKRVLKAAESRNYPKIMFREKKSKERYMLRLLVDQIFAKVKNKLRTCDASNAVQTKNWFDLVKNEIKLRKSLFIQTYGHPYDQLR
ncbi:uncharacterized protein BT62DRAFT_933172 [Guyanagaster necrorhizus]|uniref:Uncharacterized protein n=1 Tax=Guyanagaster necrorhizus TaxID=856835 RepID=A0A9P7VSV0_9AGAR|nr:uncharacterized protein BT62DRAFT_933172 [Guyanagaster necrorhizus MCA 3950]KAG7445331.1 hypothetical protein BT62DRAFT_933172 [Guyanagaster necrorhizus MCA 3950]